MTGKSIDVEGLDRMRRDFIACADANNLAGMVVATNALVEACEGSEPELARNFHVALALQWAVSTAPGAARESKKAFENAGVTTVAQLSEFDDLSDLSEDFLLFLNDTVFGDGVEFQDDVGAQDLFAAGLAKDPEVLQFQAVLEAEERAAQS